MLVVLAALGLAFFLGQRIRPTRPADPAPSSPDDDDDDDRDRPPTIPCEFCPGEPKGTAVRGPYFYKCPKCGALILR